jgi:hypothetical protein
VAELIAEGDWEQWSSSRFRGELAGWTRTSGAARRDGMPAFALGMSDAAVLLQPLLSRVQSRARDEAERDRSRALGTKALLVLSTPRDGPAEWIRAGEALQRVLLRATAAGLFASYFAQPIESPSLRRRLAEAIGDRGAPQIAFRLGYGLEPRATPRRPVEEVLRRMALERRHDEALAVRPRVPEPLRAPAGVQPRAPAVLDAPAPAP